MLNDIRRSKPLVHNITNYVVMEWTANALLAVGASPVMAHAAEEVEEMVGIAQSLVVNLGTLSKPWVEAMESAMQAANQKRIPIVLDPVGAGATRLRTQTASRLLERYRPTVIRANASEVLALAGGVGATRGVDSSHAADEAIESARRLALTYGAVVCVSGAVDWITDGTRNARVLNGHPWMARVTGMGCAATALLGAYAAIHEDAFVAATQTMVLMGVCGEIAARDASGLGMFKVRFVDALGDINEREVIQKGRVELL